MKKIYLSTLKLEEIIKRLKNGEVAKFDMPGGTELTTRMIDGVLVGIDEDEIQIGDSFIIGKNKNDYYFEEEEKFEITETGLYKTRDGRKAFVYKIEDDEFCVVYVIAESDSMHVANKQGRCSRIIKESNDDIVSKWED